VIERIEFIIRVRHFDMQ